MKILILLLSMFFLIGCTVKDPVKKVYGAEQIKIEMKKASGEMDAILNANK
jgi:hypothetical protein